MHAPEVTKSNVFINGIKKGLKGSTPNGGHINAWTNPGDKALWKKAQKNPKKNITSETINKEKPIFKPFCTTKVWFPWYVASLIISRHQTYINTQRFIKLKTINNNPKYTRCIKRINPITKLNIINAAKKGQGLLLTKWYICFLNI